jgi:sulfonate transport system substrate-binding protein
MRSFRHITVIIGPGMLVVGLVVSGVILFCGKDNSNGKIGMAVEFMDHAAAAYVAQDRGWYDARGLTLASYKSYATGMALVSALARRDIQVAYMCLVPVINAYANARVPIKIVAGTHRYGYGLVVNPSVVTKVEDLERDDLRIGCVREGGAADVLMNRAIDRYGLNREKVLSRVRRMNPSRLLVAIKTRQVDAAFLPEQWASMAQDSGFEMLLLAKDIWPQMQGSVLVVKDELIKKNPEAVRKLVAVNREATNWINAHSEKAAKIVARVLSVTGEKETTNGPGMLDEKPQINPSMMQRSMNRLEFSTAISMDHIQEVIEYVAGLGYIRKSFPATEIVDTRFMQ